MVESLKRIENTILKNNNQEIKNLTIDQECEEYFGADFQVNELNVKFRKAKITPKKIGQFVTLWKRNFKKQTEPFNVNDNFDFYIIVTEQENNFGFFLFPKQILSEKQILTNYETEGKRGFRVYPDWVKTDNKQAEKTKSWQTKYFIDLTDEQNIEKFNSIIS